MRNGYPHRCRGHQAIALLAALILTSSAVVLAGAASLAEGSARAHAAHTLNGTDTAHLHLTHQYEALLYEEGPANGALPGNARAELNIGQTFTGRYTIYTRGGSITGQGDAKPHGAGRYQSFAGSLVLTGGHGRYRHVHGRGKLYGTFDRRTYAIVIQTTGSFNY
jgi:hypothetical protein